MRLMGVDPEADYGQFPYHFDRNPIVLAGQVGLGSPAAADVDVRGDVELSPLYRFTVERPLTDEFDRVRRSLAAEIERFESRRGELVGKYGGQYLALVDGEVAGVGATMAELGNRDALLKKIGRRDGVLIKQALPLEQEDERLEVYQTV